MCLWSVKPGAVLNKSDKCGLGAGKQYEFVLKSRVSGSVAATAELDYATACKMLKA